MPQEDDGLVRDIGEFLTVSPLVRRVSYRALPREP